MSERFILIGKDGTPFSTSDTLEDAQKDEKLYGEYVVGIIRIVVENGKIKHCHEVGSVDP